MPTDLLLDANAILRYLLDDNHEQYLQVCEAIKTRECFTLLSVIQEVIYVLNGYYGVSRENIKDVLNTLMDVIYIEEQSVLYTALNYYTEMPKIDFVDCLMCGYYACYHVEIMSFDKN